MSPRRILSLVLCTILGSSMLTACMSDDPDTLKLGIADSGSLVWNTFADEADKAGAKVKFMNYSDYQIQNRALTEKQVDVNQFQTLMYLAEFNVNAGENLVPVGSTTINPLAIYFKDHSSLEDVISAGSVSIPNDPSNQSRALHLLRAAGLVTLNNPDALTHTPVDIDKDNSKVTVIPVDASKTAQSYLDGQPAIINNNFLQRAGICSTTAIFADDPADPDAAPYINAFVTRPEDKDDPRIAQLVEIWNSQPVQDAIVKESQGSSIQTHVSNEQLQEILDTTESKLRAEKAAQE